MVPYRVTKSSELANASPTVALERGNYRMRAPGLRPRSLFQDHGDSVTPTRLQARATHSSSVNRNVTLLLFLLAVAVITSFGTAYYLFTKRWEQKSAETTFIKINSTFEVNESMLYNEGNEKQHVNKYMTYLPHSGFHNQRIAFENALVLAYALRRTLLVPPVRLGNKPIRYVEYDTLVMHHELSSKDGLQHCLQVPSGVSTPLECLDYSTWTTVPWTLLVNLTAISHLQALVHLSSPSQHWLRQQFNITDDDIEVLRDETPYQFRFLDTDNDFSPPTDRYSHDVYISDLATSNATLLQFGTLFGTSRLRLKHQVYLDFRRLIRESMAIANQDLVNAAGFIALQLQGHFVSVHLRAGDGHFEYEASTTVNNVWRNLLRDVMELSDATVCTFARKIIGMDVLHCQAEHPCIGNCTAPLSTPKFLASKRSALQCRRPLHQNLAYSDFNTPLYVATDLRDPEIHPDLELFRTSFPCIFFLNDFSLTLQALKTLRSPYDGVDLFPFLLPLVDGMVAGKALRFVGTEGSTFSKFVMNFWQKDHKIPGSH